MNEGGNAGVGREIWQPRNTCIDWGLGTRVLRLAAALLAARPRATGYFFLSSPSQGQSTEHVSETNIPFLTQPEIKSLNSTMKKKTGDSLDICQNGSQITFWRFNIWKKLYMNRCWVHFLLLKDVYVQIIFIFLGTFIVTHFAFKYIFNFIFWMCMCVKNKIT